MTCKYSILKTHCEAYIIFSFNLSINGIKLKRGQHVNIKGLTSLSMAYNITKTLRTQTLKKS